MWLVLRFALEVDAWPVFILAPELLFALVTVTVANVIGKPKSFLRWQSYRYNNTEASNTSNSFCHLVVTASCINESGEENVRLHPCLGPVRVLHLGRNRSIKVHQQGIISPAPRERPESYSDSHAFWRGIRANPSWS